jgi:hypothetical protein
MTRHNNMAQRQRLMRQQSRRRQIKQAQARRLIFNECGRVIDSEGDTVHPEGEGLRSPLPKS